MRYLADEMMGAFLHLIRSFLVEELRLRGSFSPAFSLILFPQMILMGALVGYLFHPYVLGQLSVQTLHFSVCAGLLIFGTTMGSLAFLGKDLIERSIGPVTMLAASVLYHPVSDKRMYIAYYLHDAIFFLFLILIPLGAGLALGTLVSSMTLGRFVIIALSYSTSFYLGLSLSMSLSACLTNGRRVYLILVPVLLLPLVSIQLAAGDPRAFAVPYLALSGGDPVWIGITMLLILFYSAKGAFLFDGTSKIRGRESPWSYSKARVLAVKLGSRAPPLFAREVLNLIRGRAYLGMAFSLVVPVLIMIALVGIIHRMKGMEFGINTVFISVTASIFTVSVYTNLVNTDDLDFDQTIPLDVPGLVSEKLRLHIVIALPVSLLIVSILAILAGDIPGLAIGIPISIVTVIYMGCVTAYLTGLWTNSLLFNSAVFIQYILLIILPIISAGLLGYLVEVHFWVSIAGSALYVAIALAASHLLKAGIEKKWRNHVLKSGGLG